MEVNITTKICARCKVEKVITDFYYLKNKAKYACWCKKCSIESAVRWSKNNRQRRRNCRLKHAHGITLETYDGMVIRQNQSCLICHRKPKQLVVDHCHKTNKIRGLLCNTCNIGLGYFEDNISTLNKAIKYLKLYQHTGDKL